MRTKYAKRVTLCCLGQSALGGWGNTGKNFHWNSEGQIFSVHNKNEASDLNYKHTKHPLED